MDLLNRFNSKKKIQKIKKRKYEGASKSKRTQRWFTNGSDANAEIAMDLNTLRNRSRDLRRNNPIAKRAIEEATNGVVGTGIRTIIKGSSKDILQVKWNKWAGTTKCDYDGQNNLMGLQRLILDAVQESGEVLVRRRSINDMEFPFQFQVMEADFLKNSLINELNPDNENKIIQGVEYNKSGKRVAYHLYKTHPGSVDFGMKVETIRVPANEMWHIFRQERPGQVRGVPWSSAIMIRIKDLDDFQDAQLMRQKIASLFTAFVHDINADVDSGDDSDEDELGATMEPGIIEELPAGKTVTFANPPGVENYKEFIGVNLRGIAVGYGLSYEALSGDLSEVNFSSAKMGWNSMQRNFDVWRAQYMKLKFMDPVFEVFLSMMDLTGVLYSADTASKHIPPRQVMIDPAKEVPSTIKSIRAGLTSLPTEIARTGEDPDEVLQEIADSNKKTEDMGLILDSNPKYTNISGKLQEGEISNEETQDD